MTSLALQHRNPYGLSVAPVDTVRGDLRLLSRENERVRGVYEHFNKIHAVVNGRRGVLLNSFARIIVKLIRSEIAKYRSFFRSDAPVQLPAASQALSEEALRHMESTLSEIVLNKSNDPASRINKIALFFAAIVIEKVISEAVLPPQRQQTRRHDATGNLVPLSDTPTELTSPKFLARRAMVVFFLRKLRDNFSQLCDGANDVLEGIDTFALQCVVDYNESMPAYLPVELHDHIQPAQGQRQQ